MAVDDRHVVDERHVVREEAVTGAGVLSRQPVTSDEQRATVVLGDARHLIPVGLLV